MTLMMLAAAGGHDDILRLLIRKGAKLNCRQKNGTTALIHAAEKVCYCSVSFFEVLPPKSLLSVSIKRSTNYISSALLYIREIWNLNVCFSKPADLAYLVLKNGCSQ